MLFRYSMVDNLKGVVLYFHSGQRLDICGAFPLYGLSCGCSLRIVRSPVWRREQERQMKLISEAELEP